ncbi:dihydropteroate synthase [Dehalogenimonas alkenigignens]|uniref:dihydropteroate synthase n=1 Tax=Dehalogenimonas alkenigignens TaxID=1217799 RepID=UPI00196A991A
MSFNIPLAHPTRIGSRTFHWGRRTYVMGILNVTPDSFSGDGLGGDIGAAVAQAERMAAEGADIIDVGGESTRPGAPEVSAAEEISRVVPVIERLKAAIDLPVSIDSYKAEVAEAAVRAGASLLNDVWGLKRDARLADVAARRGLPIVISSSQRDAPAADIMTAVLDSLRWAIGRAAEAGIARENIILDPGFGFGKTVEQNVEVLRRLDELKALGRPVLLGTSRKSTIGKVLGDAPPQERLFGTVATTAIGIMNGADIVRVHDVTENVQAARMADAVARGVTVYLGLGSNLGDRKRNLALAVEAVSRDLHVNQLSPVYETEPWNVAPQPRFLNMAIEAQTTLSPSDLLDYVKNLERMLGRAAAGPGQPRVIDIDILLYGDQVLDTPALTLPHPRLAQRAFNLVPLNDLDPELKHPATGRTAAEMLSALGQIRGVAPYPENTPD